MDECESKAVNCFKCSPNCVISTSGIHESTVLQENMLRGNLIFVVENVRSAWKIKNSHQLSTFGRLLRGK